MMSVVRRPVSNETSRSRSFQKIGFSQLSSEKPRSESSKKSNRSNKSLPEIQTQTRNVFEDSLPTPITPYTTGWDEFGILDNLGDFLAGEIPIEQPQFIHYRRDSSIELSSTASTAYFSTTQSVHSKNDSLYSFSNNSKRLTHETNSSENSKKNMNHDYKINI